MRGSFENLIQDIVKTKSGSETWEAIKSSGHNLMLVHEHEALDSAGKALAELSHARHKMNGTWDMMHSEERAIRDENVYRHEVAPENPNLKSLDWDKGVQIWPHQKQDLLF